VSDRELLTECLDVLTHDAAQRTFAGGVRMSQLAIKLRAHLAAPRPEIQVMVDPAALTAAAAYAPVRIVTPDDAEIAQAAKFEKAYQNNRTALAAPSEDIEALRRDAELGRWIREETPPIEEIAARVDAMEDET
jgi:type II secretory pathway component PulM